jgi:hypothetical protein
MRAIDKPARIVPNVERMIVARIERLENAARDSDRVRIEAQELMPSWTPAGCGRQARRRM